jgi:hypothetical protein
MKIRLRIENEKHNRGKACNAAAGLDVRKRHVFDTGPVLPESCSLQNVHLKCLVVRRDDKKKKKNKVKLLNGVNACKQTFTCANKRLTDVNERTLRAEYYYRCVCNA